uniref:Uncharacterized protein n=1 Tax=Anguilla anguilla TaxID=7936 RepID=A0A0E9P8W0_ANGAN
MAPQTIHLGLSAIIWARTIKPLSSMLGNCHFAVILTSYCSALDTQLLVL